MMAAGPPPGASASASVPARSDTELREANRHFYESLWRDARLVMPERFNTWPVVSSLLPAAQRRLEVAPGLRPRLPVSGTHFVDISISAVRKLREDGGEAVLGLASSLPYPDQVFDLVCALDIIEHIDDDDRALAELARVAKPDARLLLSVPLHAAQWTAFDHFVGHRRRYEPDVLVAKLSEVGFTVEQSAIFGMQPRSSRLLDLGMWFLTHRRQRAMWWYNHVFMPLGVRSQKELKLTPGLAATEGVDEILLLCRKCGSTGC
jgi:SAM-dependent methyltransferase